MSNLIQDVIVSLRLIRKRPGTSALAVLALALGIGLTTTMFSIVQGAFLRGLPVPDADAIVNISRQHFERQNVQRNVPVDDFLDWREQQQSFVGLAGFYTPALTLAEDDLAATRYRGGRLTANTLSLLQIPPAQGRGFTEADEVEGAPDVVIISDDVWRRRYEARPDIVGRITRVNGEPATIIGVMPPGFGFPNSQDVWMPLRLARPEARNEGLSISVIGRLKPGATAETAARDMQAIAARLGEAYEPNKAYTAIIQPFMEAFLGSDVMSVLLAMLGAVFGVLLIACANVTNLQLARAAERTKEVAIRSALGAARWRIVRQMVVEGVLLASVGAIAGLGLAVWAIGLFNRGIADTEPPYWIDIYIDPTVVLFVVGITAFAAIVSTVWPAMRVSRTPAATVLKDEGRSSTGLRAGLVTRVLVTVAVAISCGLLIVSGLMVKSVAQLAALDYPFATENVLHARLAVLGGRYSESGERTLFLDRVHQALRRIPGARAAALSSFRPGSDVASSTVLMADAPIPPAEAEDLPQALWGYVTPGFFDTLALDIISGRDISETDVQSAPRVGVVNESFQRTFFPAGAVGRSFRLGRSVESPIIEIVGVAPDLAVNPEAGEVTAQVLMPVAQQGTGVNLFTLVATSGVPETLGPAMRQAVMDIDRDAALDDMRSLAAALYEQGWVSRVFGGLFASFGVAALVMATAGLYGVLAFGVRRRTSEIGLRMALGAGKRQVLTMILRQGLTYVAIGLVFGIGIGALLGPMLEELLWRVEPYDIGVFSTTVAVLAVTGLVASLVPALRAASVAPLVALRHE